MAFALHELGLTLEGSAAVALAAVLSPDRERDDASGDLVVASTGRNVDPDRLARIVC